MCCFHYSKTDIKSILRNEKYCHSSPTLDEADRRIRDAAGMLENAVPHIVEWDESAIRQLVAQVKVLSKNEISVTLKSGIEIHQSISN